MNKFILINAPIFWKSTIDNEQYLSPLGLGYIATYLAKANIDVNILDCVQERLSVEQIVQYLSSMKPNYLGINIFSQNYEIVKYIIENIDFECDCFIGGQVTQFLYNDILTWNSNNEINIIIGESELILPSIIKENCIESPIIEDHLKRVFQVGQKSNYYPKNISDISLDRKYFTNETIINHYNEVECSIVTSRGCPFDCAFCGGAKSLHKDSSIRYRNEKSIIQEINEIISIYPDVQSIRILDDLFLRSKKSVDMAYSIFSNFPQLRWRGMIHVLSLINDLDSIKKLYESKCSELFIGIESGSERIRKKINKKGTIDEIIKVSTEILNDGVDLKGYFIYGFPDETENDFLETYNLALKIREISNKSRGNFRPSVFRFRPYHGTKLYNEIIRNKGSVGRYKSTEEINSVIGRKQFNFDSGNFSLASDVILDEFIIKTQEI